MIIGLGTDLVDIRRIERSIARFGSSFCNRIFSEQEKELCDSRTEKKRTSAYAMRFAAKEACSKALGTGLRQGVFWKDMQVKHMPSGKPYMVLSGGALKRLETLVPKGYTHQIDVSLTDEYPYAMAVVIISAEKKQERKE